MPALLAAFPPFSDPPIAQVPTHARRLRRPRSLRAGPLLAAALLEGAGLATAYLIPGTRIVQATTVATIAVETAEATLAPSQDAVERPVEATEPTVRELPLAATPEEELPPFAPAPLPPPAPLPDEPPAPRDVWLEPLPRSEPTPTPAVVVERPQPERDAHRTPPEPLPGENEPPPYPARAVRLGHAGIVQLRLCLDMSGRVVEVLVARSSGSPLLDLVAAKALGRWRFPAGSPAHVTWQIEFRLEGGQGTVSGRGPGR